MTEAQVVLALRAAGCVFAEDEAALLVAEAAPGELDAMVARRAAGEPLEQIVGWAEFMGLRIALEPGVFVPRFRTGFLAACAIELTGPDATVLDLCCGAGAIGAAVLAARPGVDLFAADVDPAAVTAARRNLLADRVFEGDLFDPLPRALLGRVDVLVVNAPYVPSEAISTMPPEARVHEHRVALDGGADGLDFHRRIAAEAGEWLAPGGYLLVESSEAQAPVSAAIFAAAGFDAGWRHSDDYDGTVVTARLVADRSL